MAWKFLLGPDGLWPVICFVLPHKADVRTLQVALVTESVWWRWTENPNPLISGRLPKNPNPRFLPAGAKWSDLITTLPGSNTSNCWEGKISLEHSHQHHHQPLLARERKDLFRTLPSPSASTSREGSFRNIATQASLVKRTFNETEKPNKRLKVFNFISHGLEAVSICSDKMASLLLQCGTY